jgi:hypothetical protein
MSSNLFLSKSVRTRLSGIEKEKKKRLECSFPEILRKKRRLKSIHIENYRRYQQNRNDEKEQDEIKETSFYFPGRRFPLNGKITRYDVKLSKRKNRKG